MGCGAGKEKQKEAPKKKKRSERRSEDKYASDTVTDPPLKGAPNDGTEQKNGNRPRGDPGFAAPRTSQSEEPVPELAFLSPPSVEELPPAEPPAEQQRAEQPPVEQPPPKPPPAELTEPRDDAPSPTLALAPLAVAPLAVAPLAVAPLAEASSGPPVKAAEPKEKGAKLFSGNLNLAEMILPEGKDPLPCETDNSMTDNSMSLSSPRARGVCRHVTTVELRTDEKGHRWINEYQCVRSLGSGRFGEVFLVQREPLPGEIPPEDDEEELYAMKQVLKKAMKKDKQNKEVEILKKLNHPNVVRLYEVMDDPGLKEMYMIFELVDGGPIMELGDDGIVEGEPLADDTLRNYMSQIADGLQYLHDLNIVHRDIKPDNILVTKADIIKIADLGVSRLLNTEDDGSRDTGGTPLFLSPEACRGEFASGKSNDVWALGVTLYILMYGYAPFKECSNEILLYNSILDDDIEYPEEPPHKPELLALLKRMLERNPLMRITLNEVRNNPWVRGGTAALGEEELERVRQLRQRQIFGKDKKEEKDMVRDTRAGTTTTEGKQELNILIVEDVFLIQKVTAKMFRAIMDSDTHTLNVKCVADGEDAVEACKSTRYNLTLMDVHMSRMSGVAATALIREHELQNRFEPTNIIGLTADPHEDMVKLCIEAGMQEVVQKPLQPAKLREVCARFNLPVKDGEASFSATADFEKGEVKGGAKKNAFLKSYEEHLQKQQKQQEPTRNEGGGVKGKIGSASSGICEPRRESNSILVDRTHSEPRRDSTMGGLGASFAADVTSIPERRESVRSRPRPSGSGDWESRRTESFMKTPTVVQLPTLESPEGSELLKSNPQAADGLRQRALQSMRKHDNMYKRKDCSEMFAHMEEDEIEAAPTFLLLELYTELGWTSAGQLGIDGHTMFRKGLAADLPGWLVEVKKKFDGRVPRAEITEQVTSAAWWSELQTPQDSVEPRKNRFEVFCHAEKGKRGLMEDCHSVLLEPSAVYGKDQSGDSGNEVIVGMFDGHGGVEAAAFCQRYILGRIAQAEQFATDPAAVMSAEFKLTNQRFFEKIASGDCDAGTTALVALARGNTITIANAGDCRAVLSTGGSAQQLTELHIASNADERQAVESRGGSVIHYGGSWRVNGMLLVTRTIGDFPCRDVVTAEPSITTRTVGSEDEFLVIASDGLWDVMTPEEVCDAVRSARAEIMEALAEKANGGGEEEEEEKKEKEKEEGKEEKPKGEGEEEEEEEEGVCDAVRS
eukprot:Hpha_TRINITY_DN16283_c7_g1::TRINITY_DN16283_c7_g1_i1::g.16355::m.16355/K07359/CAMKK2; calcium/calmodulin-dependent protein kinase kinase 2